MNLTTPGVDFSQDDTTALRGSLQSVRTSGAGITSQVSVSGPLGRVLGLIHRVNRWPEDWTVISLLTALSRTPINMCRQQTPEQGTACEGVTSLPWKAKGPPRRELGTVTDKSSRNSTGLRGTGSIRQPSELQGYFGNGLLLGTKNSLYPGVILRPTCFFPNKGNYLQNLKMMKWR